MGRERIDVSVIIPAYNSADILPRAIQSVLNQTFRNFEVIVVDDASTDDTEHVVRSLGDDRIQYIRHKTNKGASSARNTGISIATGEFIAFLDADDEWVRKKLERQIYELRSRSSEWVAIHCARMDEAGVIAKVRDTLAIAVGPENPDAAKEGSKEVIGELLSLNIKTGSSTLVVRRNIVEKIGGFDPEFERHQDWEFLIRILQHGKIAYIDDPLVVKHATGQPDAAVFEDAKEHLFTKFQSEILELEASSYEVTRIQKIHLAKMYIEEGKIRSGFRKLPKDWRDFPMTLSVLWSLLIGVARILSP